eukprot:GDKJ01009701.1.p1 GENE.GDKJ01009701.1~~GDKJ01009701.1.p1  ORF type:complete len:1013 (+),score=244.40 GDKJ01009701.1:257-3040(+)
MTKSVYLILSCKISGEGHDGFIIESKRPQEEYFCFRAANTAEQESWMDIIDKGILWERSKEAKTLALLQSGAPMYRYQVGRAPLRRFFWLSPNVQELCWSTNVNSTAPDENCSKEDLKEALGITFTTRAGSFASMNQIEHPSYFCFSILFSNRTLDLAVVGEQQIAMWFLGLQSVIARIGGAHYGGVKLPILSYQSFMRRKLKCKLIETAHKFYVTFNTLMRFRVRKIALDFAQEHHLRIPLELSDRIQRHQRQTANKTKSSNNSDTPPTVTPTAQSGSMSPFGTLPDNKPFGAALPILSEQPDPAEAEANKQRAMRLAELEEEFDAANKELTSLKKKYKKLRTWASTAEVDMDVLEKALEVAKEGGQISEGQITDIEYSVMKERYEEAEQARAQSEEKIDTLKKQIEKLERFKNKNTILENQLHDMDDAVTAAAGNSNAVQSKVVNELQAQIRTLTARLAAGGGGEKSDSGALEAENSELKLRLTELESQNATQKEVVAGLQAKIARLQDSSGNVDTYRSMQKQVAYLKKDFEVFRDSIGGGVSAMFGSEWSRLQMYTEQLINNHRDLEVRYGRVCDERKTLHNLVLELKGNIRVFARVRPLKKFEAEEEPPGGTLSYQDDNKLTVFTVKDGRKKGFEFDRVFRPNEGQKPVFDEAKPLITSVLDGFNVCIMAYGQTGSGKTHTMSGTKDDPGLNLRALSELFDLKTSRSSDFQINITLAVLEIYNEEIRDLLMTTSSASQVKKLDVKTDGSIPGLIETEVTSADDVLRLIDEANRNRSVAATDMNEHSSRSHAVVQVRTTCTQKGGDAPGKTFSGKLYLVDLAGSEDVGKSGVTGSALEEAKKINRSLSALGSVIGALCADNPHVPYRDSKLTMVLRDALGGDAKALLIVQTSPYQKSTVETLSSLNFASKARNVENAPAKRNVH